MSNLAESRKKIDEIDKEIAKLFNERMKVSEDVAAYKAATGKPVYDPVREEEKLHSIESLSENEFTKTALREIFSSIMSISRKYQYSRLSNKSTHPFMNHLPSSDKIGFYGGVGSYTELAMKDFFGKQTVGYSYQTFKELCLAIKNEEMDYGVLPIENSTTGSISDIYELLSEHSLHILGEKIEPIDHALLALSGTNIDEITDIFSHAEPLLQCSDFLSSMKKAKTHSYGSTSESALMVKALGNKNFAAIASKRKAEFYGLHILSDHIANDVHNATRFILVGKKEIYLEGANKINLCFDILNKSGSLYNIISNFIYNNVNMVAIESRAIPEKRWKYRFFVELEGNLNDENIRNALFGIKEETEYFTILGNYISADKI